MDSIIQSVLKHEGLIQYQLPVRITHPSMKKWKTYQGFPLMQDESKKPHNRRNFLFLQRQEDIVPAMRKQFERYVSLPARFHLPPNPTLADSLRAFDQQYPEAKMKMMATELPGIDFTKPLADYIHK